MTNNNIAANILTGSASGITDVVKVWDNGTETPFDPYRPDLVEYHNSVRFQTGAKFGVATSWKYNGSVYQDSNSPTPIPDMSGLVYVAPGWKQWVIVNPDSSIRVVIDVPHVREHSNPAKGDLGEPRYFKGDPLHIMYGEGSDGYHNDCRFFFNMHTGELLRTEFMSRHW